MGIPLWLVCILVGVVIGFFVVSVMKSQLKTVRRKSNAATYIRNDGLHLTLRQDIFLYQNTTRHPKPKAKK